MTALAKLPFWTLPDDFSRMPRQWPEGTPVHVGKQCKGIRGTYIVHPVESPELAGMIPFHLLSILIEE